MKTRFSTYDIVCSVTELQRLVGMRVNNIYDIDNKTYLIKLQRTEEKSILLLESGNRIHTTGFEWPKNVAPSGFSMKMRKHLRNKRLESLRQLGIDRVIDLQFGSGEAAYHVILELYDKGNLILTDYQMTILNILRPHTEGEAIRLAVKEKYPLDRAREHTRVYSVEELKEILANAKTNDTLKKILNPNLDYGPAVIDHVLLEAGFPSNCKLGKQFDIENDIEKLHAALLKAEELICVASKTTSKGYIIQKKEERPTTDETKEFIYTNQEFHPIIFAQHKNLPVKEFETFDAAVDEFFSTFESQKIDLKALHQEREALKKLDNVRKDHDQRLRALEETQEVDKQRAELITRNQELVDSAILAIRSAVANQLSWPDIDGLVKAAQEKNDPVAKTIKKLKLEKNHITLLLTDPYASENSSAEENEDGLKPMMIDIDLALGAFANARKYYDQKRTAASKQRKTIESQGKALKSAEKKTKQTLKQVQITTSINKARKVYWFEKFYWFISSENYLVIGGRDQQQNELIVKRYMRPGDIYVHADIHGASSVIVKNPTGEAVPPKTLNEAGIMAICYSVAWEAKVITSAWWVHANQVSKTAPTGEYLTTGSFIIRGKKNYLPPCHLIMGFSFLFKLEDGSIERHKGERRVRTIEEEELDQKKLEENGLENIEEDVELESDKEDEQNAGESDKEQEKNKSDSENNDEDEDSKNKFPDTQIKIEHFGGTKINIRPDPSNLLVNQSDDDDFSDSERVIYLGDDKPVVLKSQNQRSRNTSESKNKTQKSSTNNDQNKDQKQQQSSQLKRGQKGKLKKIKEKYKDQDDEERQLRMEILQSAGAGKETKKSKKNKETNKKQKNVQQQIKITPNPKSAIKNNNDADGGGGGQEDEDEKEITVAADVDMLDSLTGIPHSEDELLFAIPIVAPYNTLTNYKYKVKLTPGTGKRGKAARTAVTMFLRDRNTTPREKDLLRSVKDENVARNLPGKVKVSAPKLQNLKR
ncbi:nuclear export mediator factor NEMF homolog [Chrysoperla carnea]|uniref:nuclear export mediator factor NEMF homolog n=1 Tax=Chrysoperla carnea TaxID=189513 RepID=UPI001D065764|nr:nuclear export mediator factor NEMF homolog [Chrysoperla carnea]